MGMFDFLRCSKDIGELTDIECQTKDIDPWLGGNMTFYWVDPAGAIWSADYSGTADFQYNDGDDVPFWKKLKVVPNGNKGKIYRHIITNYVTIYRSKTEADGLVDFTTCRLHFVDGILQDYKYINKNI